MPPDASSKAQAVDKMLSALACETYSVSVHQRDSGRCVKGGGARTHHGCPLAPYRVTQRLDSTRSSPYGPRNARHERGFSARADVHDRSDGHSTKEVYISEVHAMEESGVRRVNRRRVFIERHAVVSVSSLSAVVTDDDTAEPEDWSP